MLDKKGRREREEQQDRELESKIFKREKTGSEKILHTLQALLK